ncbi:bifunctional riboflavin kinase/FAD synthetase [Haliangium ochraceum]|uniref:Riboflavin biosynthesis protein n=1 Tax=Haliangium ochraceum (strain DSM 14365 / JCM 11303 / SMP-2) TaxID=502025 RepID=D0LJC7_HALO1|nr:bifunctional riboflavin kinase/FAD synthetase [Haliangium ochraceum]ACY14974.1 riboflavin biosynthesis protein RibF [Haliangium ochraceum DSM 14365]
MEIFEGHRALFRPLVAPVVALGNFDGVHLGHQRLLSRAVELARAGDSDAVAFTFDPHPAAVLAPSKAPPLLTTRARKLELFAEAGLSACVVEPFTAELAALAPEAFLQSILVDIFGARHIVVGYDFTYGRARAGTTETLRAFGAARGIGVDVIAPVEAGGEAISSTRVRALVEAGRVSDAGALLGRSFDVEGAVVRGEGRGRTIGIPTANIEVGGALLPPGGVYAVRADLLGAPLADDAPRRAGWAGVANLGTKPTFGDGGEQTLEVHLLDRSDDLYGKTLRLHFVERLRAEQRFDGVDALVRQIHTDIARARELLGCPAPGAAT